MSKRYFIILLFASSFLHACSPGNVSNRKPSVQDARASLSQGDTTSAIRTLQTLVSSDNAEPEVFTTLGEIYRSRHSIKDRLRSQNILEEGLSQYPDSPMILMELGKTYYEQTFFPDAERCFFRVVELADTTCEAYYYLGLNYYRKWKRNQSFKDELQNAYKYLKRAVHCEPREPREPGNCGWMFSLAFTCYVLQMHDNSLSHCKKIIKKCPEFADAYFLKGVIAFDASDYFTASSLYDSALAFVSPGDKSHYDNITLLIQDEKQLDLFPYLSNKKKEEETRMFWIKSDPDPTTPLNERYIEHITRVWQADHYFSNQKLNLRGWETDRGIALIKFGWPAKIESDLGKGLTGRWEHWTYITTKNIFFFDFMDEFLNDNFSIPIKSGSKMQELNERPTWSAFDPTLPPVPLDFATHIFLDDPGKAILWIAVGLSAKKIKNVMLDSDVEVSFRGVLFDEDWNVEQRFSDNIHIANPDDAATPPCVYAKRIEIPFDYFHYSISFEQIGGNSGSVYSSEVNTRIYLGDSLAMSDILLHCMDKPYGRAAYVTRNNERFLPNASREYFQGEDLGLYFEIYHLKLRERVSNYDISYTIHNSPLDSQPSLSTLVSDIKSVVGVTNDTPPTISQTILRSGRKHNESEALWVDIQPLATGRYTVKINVIDRNSGEMCEAEAVFYKVVTE